MKEELETRKEELEAQDQKEALALKLVSDIRASELNVSRIVHEQTIATKFDLGRNV